MIVLDASTKLEAVLDGAVSANQPVVHFTYHDWSMNNELTAPATFRAALSSTADVTILAAPTTSPRREPIAMSLYNKDTASVTVTLKSDDGTTEYVLAKITLLTLESLHWTKATGLYALDVNGNRKEATATTFATITSAGLLDISGASAGQISFPATQNASSGANVLDDYEEGTFTPAIAFGGAAVSVTYSVQVGRYTKIGNTVNIRIYLVLSNNGSSVGDCTITGLPFTANAATNGRSAFAVSPNNLTGISGHITCQILPSGTTLILGYLGTGTGTNLSDTTVTNTAGFVISGTYEA